MRSIVAILALLLISASATAQSQNAAEIYRMAAKAVPQPAGDAETRVFADVFAAPLDQTTRQILSRGSVALGLFDIASPMPFGQWGYDADDPLAAGRIVNDADRLADLIVLRARTAAAAGKFTAAIDDCFNIAQLARRLSVQPSLARQNQQNALMDRAVQLFGLILPDLPPADAGGFISRLPDLRSPVDPFQVIQTERRTYLWVHDRLLHDAEFRALADRTRGGLNEMFGLGFDPVDISDLRDVPVSAELVFRETERAFDDLLIALQQPPAEQAAALKAELQRISGAHPLVRGAGKIAARSVQLSQRQAALLDLLKVAVRICTDQPRPLDPLDASRIAEPFAFTPVPGGFELRHMRDDQAIVLRIGPRPAAPAATTTRRSPTTLP